MIVSSIKANINSNPNEVTVQQNVQALTILAEVQPVSNENI